MKSYLTTGALFPALLALAAHAAESTAPAPTPMSDQTVEMSPFTVSTENDSGYFSKNTLLGTRSNERLVNIPQSIAIVNRQFLNDVGNDNGLDAVKYGVSGVEKRTATSGDLFLRGFRLATLRDSFAWRGNGTINIPLYDIDRVEVIKGPAALILGSSATSGGTVNYVSQQTSAKPEYSATGTYGSFNLYRGLVSASGPVFDGDRYRITLETSDSDGPRNFDYYKDVFGSFIYDHKVSATSTLHLYYNYLFTDNIISSTSADKFGQVVAYPKDLSFVEPWADGRQWTQYALASLRTELNPTLHMVATVNASDHDFNYHSVLAAGVPDLATGLLQRSYQNYQGHERRINAQLDLLKTFSTGPVNHKVAFGAGGDGQRLFQYVDTDPMAPLNIFNPVYNAPRPQFQRGVPLPGGSATGTANVTREESAYVSEQANAFNDRLILVVGEGYNGFNNTTTNRIANTTTTRDDKAFVKRYGAVIKPINALSVYYNYSESFAFNNSVFVGGPRDGQRLDPSFTKNREVGLKSETPDGLLFGSVDYFDMVITNVKFLYALPNGQTGTGESNGNHSRGWEGDVGLNFRTPAGPGQAILTYYAADNHDVTGATPFGVSRSTWSAFFTQRVDRGFLKGLKIGAGAFYKSAFTMANASGQTVPLRAPSFTTSTGFINYGYQRLNFALSVDNIFNKYYIDGGDTAGTINMARGREAHFSVSFRY